MKPFLQNLGGLLLLFCSVASSGQASSIERTIRESDSLFWIAYNQCDIEGMHAYIAEDVEFYHDKGGIQKGWKILAQTTRNNLCSRTGWRLRREETKGTTKMFPMESDGKIYGAILSGEHQFFVTEDGKPEYASGSAKFTHLWLVENENWKMSRILSYDHGAPHYLNKRTAISLSPKTLKQFQGKYDSKQGVITVSPKSGWLSLSLGGNVFEIFPESETVFFASDRDLTFEFVRSGTKVTRMIVRENGQIIENDPIVR